MAFPRKLKIAPTILPTIAGNASAAFRASLLKVSTSLSNYFLKAPLSFDGRPPVPPVPPKITVMARTIAAMVIEKAVHTETIVIPCSLNKIWILSTKDASLSRTFSMICLIIPTCV